RSADTPCDEHAGWPLRWHKPPCCKRDVPALPRPNRKPGRDDAIHGPAAESVHPGGNGPPPGSNPSIDIPSGSVQETPINPPARNRRGGSFPGAASGFPPPVPIPDEFEPVPLSYPLPPSNPRRNLFFTHLIISPVLSPTAG